MTAPVERGEVLGYVLASENLPDYPFDLGPVSVYWTVEEARERRNHAAAHGRTLRIVEFREVIVE